MKVKVLGPGCPKCRKLYEEARKAIAAAGVNAELEKVDRINDIIRYGVMMVPGLVIDDDVKASGRVPASDEIEAWIKAAAGIAGK